MAVSQQPRRGIRALVAGFALFAGVASAAAPPRDFSAALASVRTDLTLENGAIAGPGAAVLLPAIAEAKYVFLGEDHATHEIPLFAAALCDAMAAQGGLTAMAVEAGPEATKFVTAAMAQPNPEQAIVAQMAAYPDSIAFFNFRDEVQLAGHCAHAGGGLFHLWGLDSELFGSAGWLLSRIAAEHPEPPAAGLVADLQSEEGKTSGRALDKFDAAQLFMFKAKQAALDKASAALSAAGNATAQALFQSLLTAHTLYAETGAGANTDRALLQKQTLAFDMQASSIPVSGRRILLKFGDDHGYKGLNPQNQRDLGNYIAELAEGEGAKSLHIAVLGARGTHRLYGGYGKPTNLVPFTMTDDPAYRWLKPAIDNQSSNGWTLYDLRPLRFRKYKNLDPGMERAIYGYDLLLIVPEITPAEMVQSSPG